MEGYDGLLPSASVKVLQALKGALEEGGLEFIGTPEDGAGVRFKKR